MNKPSLLRMGEEVAGGRQLLGFITCASLKINNLFRGKNRITKSKHTRISGFSTNVDAAQNTSQIPVSELFNAVYRIIIII